MSKHLTVTRAGTALAVFLLLCCVASAAFGDASPWTGTWIWSETPRGDNYFRKVVTASGKVTSAKIAITADNIFELYVNGAKIGSDDGWSTLEVYDITKHIRPGGNIIAVKATDPDVVVGALLVEGAFNYSDGTSTVFGTDNTWKLSGDKISDWTDLNFDDSAWQTPRVIGKPPVGPWGGIDHPILASGSPIEIISICWPARADLGSTISVTCEVRPKRRIVTNSPVGLRILTGGEIVCEQWIEPDTPVTTWEPGKTISITFPSFYLPIYLPKGKMQAQVVTTATESVNAKDVWIGPKAAPIEVPIVSVSKLRVVPVEKDGITQLRVEAAVKGAPRGSTFLLTLMRGEEMWFAAEAARFDKAQHAGLVQIHTMLLLPEGFPGGTYTARILPHKAVCVSCPDVKITIDSHQAASWKPFGYGKYMDRDGVPHRWYVNKQGALIWDGKPYIPVGAQYLSIFFGEFKATDQARNEAIFNEEMERLRTIKAAGVTDLYLNPCKSWKDNPAWVWQRFADMCEELGFNYGLQVTKELERLKGYHIAQDEHVVKIKGGESAKATIKGMYLAKPSAESSVLYAAFDSTTDTFIEWGKASVKLVEKAIEVEAAPKVDIGRAVSVHFIPEYTHKGDMHNYWRDINSAYKAELDSFFSALKLGPNFRLWLDPLGNEQGFREANRMLPHSAEFRAMFGTYLKAKYPTAEAVTKAWAISSEQDHWDYSTLARLIPLGKPSNNSDIGYALDETTGRTYKVDLTKSTMWHDMLRFRDDSVADFDNMVADMIKRHHDVPVVLKVTDTDCFTNSRTHGGFDGLGMEAYTAAPELVRGCGGGVYSRCKQSNRTMWTLVTETGLAEQYVGYPDPIRLVKEFGSMVEMNAKGTFLFLFCAPGGKPGEGWYNYNLLEDPRQLYWVGVFGKIMKNSPLLPEYEAEADYYWPGMIAGQQSGFERARAAVLSSIPSQSVPGESGRWVIPATTRIPVDARRVIVNIEDSPATEIYGQNLESALRQHEIVIVGHRRNLGTLSVDSYYTDRFVTDSDMRVVQALSPTPTSRVFARASDGTPYGLTDGNLTIYSKSDWLRSVKKMAGRMSGMNLFRNVFDLKYPDIGKAFQSMEFDWTTCLWNLTDSEKTLAVHLPPKSSDVTVADADGSTRKAYPGEAVSIGLPQNARRPAIIRPLRNAEITGIDEANLAAALLEWNKATKKAGEVGLKTPTEPPTQNWRELYKLAGDLQKKADDLFRTTTAARMPEIVVDGELSEWAAVKPIYLNVDIGIDSAKAAIFDAVAKYYTGTDKTGDYDGAKFYTGYDEGYIYVAGDVTDETVVNNYSGDNLWNGDAIEVLIDLNPNARPDERSYDSDCFRFIFAPKSSDGVPAMAVGSPSLPSNSIPRHSLWAVKRTSTGWRFEAAVSRLDMNGFELAPGKTIGFTVQLDGSNGGNLVSEKIWRGGKDADWNRLIFGRLALE